MKYIYGMQEVQIQNNILIIPDKYIEYIGIKGIITKGLDDCLCIYNQKEFENYLNSISVFNKNQATRALFRQIMSNSYEINIDNKKIIIPSKLCTDIEDNVVIVGMLNYIEIWSKNKFTF